jgi:sugar phosphate isomerase/epimerase
MRLTVSNYSFEVLPLEPTLMICHALGFKGVDIGGFHARGRCSFEPEEVTANPQKQADILKPLLEKYELQVVDFFPQFGANPSEHSINDPDPAIRERDLYLIRGAAQFCKLIDSPGMTILPGVDHPSRPLAENLELSGQMLKQAVAIAGEYGVELRFEPHMGSVSDTPELALQLVEAAPGLKVTLDVSHFVLQYIPLERIYKLIPHTGHVHIRATRPGKLQVAYDESSVDFVDLINRLKAANYDAALTVEYVCADWFGINRNDTLYETMVTKQALEKYVSL